jgi:proteasome assembly chaperone (PAC2) family protein
MTEDAIRLSEVPRLREPVLIMAFGGWNDAAEAATGAVRYLIRAWGAIKFAEIDPEDFYDFTETRPQVRLRNGLQRQIEWPANEFHYVRARSQPHDYVLMTGVEPQLRWRRFCSTLMEVVRRVNVRQVVLLGGLIADVPHTRPVRVSGSSTDATLTRRLESLQVHGSRYEGPTGIVGVFSDLLRREGVACSSLWATVPHYISTANPRATQALLTHLDTLLGLQAPLGELEQEAQEFDTQVARAVERDPDVAAYVRQLEESDGEGDVDDEEPLEERHELPTGEALLHELEEFLRRSRGDSGS